MRCKNVVGARTDPGNSDYLVHFTEHRRCMWDPHTAESYARMKEALDDRAQNNPGELPELQLMLGLNRNPLGLLWDDYISSMIDMPKSHFWDAMHCEFASGGCAQYLANGFALAAQRHGIDLLDLDSFTQSVCGHNLTRSFWSTRVVQKRGAHIRAFASETLDAVYVLNLFCDAVLAHAGVMQEHARAVRLKFEVVIIFSRPDDILHNVHRLDAVQEEYQEIHQRLYCKKPKTHLTRHIVDSILEHGVFFTCWAPEREHSRSKDIARSSFRNCGKTLLDRNNHHFYFDLLHDGDLLRETHLVNPVECDSFQQELGRESEVQASRELMSHVGAIRRGDFVHVLSEPRFLLKAMIFLEVRLRGQIAHVVVGYPHESLGSKMWRPKDQTACVAARQIIRRDIVRVDHASNIVQANF